MDTLIYSLIAFAVTGLAFVAYYHHREIERVWLWIMAANVFAVSMVAVWNHAVVTAVNQLNEAEEWQRRKA